MTTAALGELRVLTSACNDAAVFNIDAGFNIGQTSSAWFKQYGDSLCVLAFEPNPQLEVKRALRHNRHLHVVRAAIGEHESESMLWYGEQNVPDGRGGFRPGQTNTMRTDEGTLRTDLRAFAGKLSTGRQHRVQVMRLGPYLRAARRLLPASVTFGHLKTDLQGSDMAGIRGAGELIEQFRCVSMELWGTRIMREHYADPVPYMRSRGFVVVQPTVMFGKQVWVNFRRANFGQITAHFLNVKMLPAFASANASESWPAYCHLQDGRVDHAFVRQTALRHLSRAGNTSREEHERSGSPAVCRWSGCI